MTPANAPTFTEAEIEKMRLLVTEHDKSKSVHVFDLNNPPRTTYVHQPFPKLVYDLDDEGGRIHKKVHDAEEHEAALAQGWANEPKAPAEADEIELDPASAAEAARIDAELKKKKKKSAAN
jgi:hypothetical protein